MNIQQHERISRIKKLSRYLHLSLTCIFYLFGVAWLLIVIFILVGTTGESKFFGDIPIKNVDLTYLQRIILAMYFSFWQFFTLKLVYHFRELIRHFADGDVFNNKAIEHARKTLLNGVVIYGAYLGILLFNWVFTYIKQPPIHVSINSDYILGFMFFGLMYVLLWALEIGRDLNEESELTI